MCELAQLLDVKVLALMREAAALPLPPSERDADEAYNVLRSHSAGVTNKMRRGVFEWWVGDQAVLLILLGLR